MQTLEIPGLRSIDYNYSSNRIGDISEFFVLYSALKRGAEVFYNHGSAGKADLVLKINDQLYEIDVKTAVKSEKGLWRAKNCDKVKPPVWALVVTPYPDKEYECRWPHKWGNQHAVTCPPGLEDFWQ